jgi:hypothetical protein
VSDQPNLLETVRSVEDLAGLSEDNFFRWREAAREHMRHHDKPALRELYKSSNAELDQRARRSWQRGGA